MKPTNIYAGVLALPSSDFDAVRDGRTSTLKYQDIDLSVARADADAFVMNAAGNSFYVDANPSDGVAFIEFQDSAQDSATVQLYASPGFIANLPFTYFKVVNTAQPGKKIRVAYGVDIDFQPGSIAQIAVTNVGGYTSIRPEESTGFFNDVSTIVANTPITVFTPAVNINGAVLLSAHMADIATAAQLQVFIAKNSAPANIGDGEIMLMSAPSAVGAAQYSANSLHEPMYIGAGKGLYFISSFAGAAGWNRNCRYKLL